VNVFVALKCYSKEDSFDQANVFVQTA